MPAPTSEQIQALMARLENAVDNGTRVPTAVLSAEEHELLVDLYFHGGRLSADTMRDQLRERARLIAGEGRWTRSEINAINFNSYAAVAQERRRDRDAAIAEADNVRQIGAAGARRRRRDTTLHVETAADMVETQSTLLIALGLLEQQRAGRCWYDTFYKKHFTDWYGDDDGAVIDIATMDDSFERRAMQWLHSKDSRLARISESQAHSYLLSFAERDQRNEPRDWLNAQVWDGTARLRDLFTRGFGAPDTNFNAEAGRCWIISMVARILVPGDKVDTMPVLIGGQGLYKSQALERIGGDWYKASSSSVDSKDFLQELHGVIVMEIPELHSLISSRHGAAMVKAKLSIREDHFRLSYGRMVQTFKRTAVWVGTTNNRDWHTDDTGGRRFWPVHVGTIDLDWIGANRAQLFAEALVYYRARLAAIASGEATDRAPNDAVSQGQWWNVPADEQAALMELETVRHGHHDIIEARLLAAQATLYRGLATDRPLPWDGTVTESTDWGNVLTTTRIAYQWLGLQSAELGRGGQTGKTIGAIMRALNWELKKVRLPNDGALVNAWVPVPSVRAELDRARVSNVGQSNGTDGTNRTSGADEIEEPF